MTKRIKQGGWILFTCVMAVSCAKTEKIDNDDVKVGRSIISYFPLIATNGEQLILLKVGDAYSDEGATATKNGEETPYTTTGAVDTNTPGIYELTYEAKNEQGFGVTDYRTVVVIGNDVAANDFSGSYTRTANGQVSVWTKTGDGIYSVSNPGGAAGASDFVVTGVNFTGNKVAIPLQPSELGSFKATIATYNASETPPYYEWFIVNAGYGPALRTFEKN